MGRRIFWDICFILVGVSSCFGKTKIDLGFLVDDWSTSHVKSTTGKEREADSKAGESVKDLIRTIYGSFHVEDGTVRVGLVKSGPTAKVVFDFNAYNDLDRLDETVEQLNFPKSADSNIGKALDLVNYGLFKNSGRPEALKFLVVIAQAQSTDDVNRAARDLRNSGINILSAWSGNTIHRDDLQSIVSPPKHYNLFKDGGNSVDKLAPLIVRRIRYVASVSKVPKNIPKQKLNENQCSAMCDVKVKGGERIKIDCSNCKLVACCDKCCKNENNEPFYPGPVELAILLDESGELKDWNNFNMMKSFIKNLTREFELSNKKTKVGLVSFTDNNLQLLDLHSYHDYNKMDLQIDKLNYEGITEDSGELNKALDATQANFFTGEQDLGVPRLLIIFDSATKKDDQTDVKAFQLQRNDVQKFCIGLGTNYNKTNCRKIVEKPYKSHSLSAKVEHLSELQEAIMLMIVNDISAKYCPLCVQGTTAACKPCKTARNLIGGDDSKFSNNKNIYSEKILKILKQGNGQTGPYKIGLKMSDSNDDDDNTKLGTSEAVKLLGGSQVATPLPSVELVKELLQSGTALNSDRNNKAPLIANDQNLLLQQNPGTVQPEAMIQQSLQPQQFVQQELPQQQSLQAQQPDNVNNLSPQLMAPAMPLNDNQKAISPLLKNTPTSPFLMNQDDALDSPLTVQPVALNPKLLSQAILETEKFQHEKSRGLPLGALSTLPVENSDFTNSIASFQGNVGTSLPLMANADVSKATQFHSSAAMPALPLWMKLGAPAPKTNWFGFPLSSAANKKSPFVDEYKYDINDKEGPFIMACKDLSDDCASYATDGGCEDFAPLSSIGDIQRMCKASCGLCERNMKLGHKRSQTKKRNRHKLNRKHKLHH